MALFRPNNYRNLAKFMYDICKVLFAAAFVTPYITTVSISDTAQNVFAFLTILLFIAALVLDIIAEHQD